MFKFILLAFVGGICATYAQPSDVSILYISPYVQLNFNDADRDIVNVTFHYGLWQTSRIGSGSPTATGWEFRGQLQSTIDDVIFCYAEIHYSSGLTINTPQATRAVGAPASSPLGARRIRSVLFRDDFNSYNKNNWSPEISMFGGYNWEFQVYTPESKNIYSSNGNLYLRPTLTVDDSRWDENFLHSGKMDLNQIWGSCTNDGNNGCVREGQYGLLPPVMSGKVSSKPTVRLSTVEVRARIPRGDWLWPAIWMMPKSSVYGAWPRSGEIDIMESRGNAGDVGVGTVTTTLHWGPSQDQNKFMMTHGERHGGDYSTGFHTYRLDWTQDHIRTYVDNQEILNVDVGSGFWAKGGFSGGNIWSGGGKAAPFDQDYFLMLNVAVGGTSGFFPDNINYGTNKPWSNSSPDGPRDFWNGRNSWLPSWQGDKTALEVDYVEFRN